MRFIRFLAVFLLLLYIPLQVQAEEIPINSSVDIAVSSEAKNLDETLTYILSDKDGREIDRITIRSGKESKFTITVTEPGTIFCTIRQVSGRDKDADYDKTVYKVDIYTTVENGTVYSEPVIYAEGSSAKSDKCRFFNSKPDAKPVEKPKPVDKGSVEKPELTSTESVEKPGAKPNMSLEFIKTGDESSSLLLLFFTGAAVTGIILLLIYLSKTKRKR